MNVEVGGDKVGSGDCKGKGTDEPVCWERDGSAHGVWNGVYWGYEVHV